MKIFDGTRFGAIVCCGTVEDEYLGEKEDDFQGL
jgi:hypothetical protein